MASWQERLRNQSLASLEALVARFGPEHFPVPNITHRYPDRALFLVSPVCASYCRFCTRRRKVGDPAKIPLSRLESAFRDLEEHTEIRDVTMSGGDPLLLSDRRIEELCKRLRSIPHL